MAIHIDLNGGIPIHLEGTALRRATLAFGVSCNFNHILSGGEKE